MAPNDSEYEIIRQMVYERSRINLGKDKRELVAARLGKRLRALNMDSYTQYLRFLRTPSGEEEIQNLIDHISTNHTFFFREIRHFDYLREEFLPEFVQSWVPKGHRCLRVWSAACSSGEEPY
ncbi:MAG: hypothetical protein NZL93_00350, partial [Chthoniobacterales bacterium]|nr:hypothetical protein [Chthoniobacterales bacterium]